MPIFFSNWTAYSKYCELWSIFQISQQEHKDVLPTQAPCLKDMRGQKMLWTSWEPCWIGKLLFSCSVPSLSTTLIKFNVNSVNTPSDTLHQKRCYTFKFSISAQRRQNCLLINSDLSSHTDLYSSSLLTQALTSREGSLASRLIQERADMLQMELPSLTTRRLALVSFPVGGMAGRNSRDRHRHINNQTQYSVHESSLPDRTVVTIPVAMSKRKEKMLPLSSPAQRILPGASKERDSTRPVSLLEPPFTFFPVEMFTTCRWCLLFPTWNIDSEVKTFIISPGQQWETDWGKVAVFLLLQTDK